MCFFTTVLDVAVFCRRDYKPEEELQTMWTAAVRVVEYRVVQAA